MSDQGSFLKRDGRGRKAVDRARSWLSYSYCVCCLPYALSETDNVRKCLSKVFICGLGIPIHHVHSVHELG